MIRKTVLFRSVTVLALVLYALLPLQTLALTIGEERKIGDQLLFSIRKELPILEDPDISQYINTLGRRVLDTVGPQYFEYRFYVVKSDQFNAFAAPAGLVFFYTGLIETMNNEDQLLSVLAHEIGHVVSRHIAQRMDKGSTVSAASLLLAIAGLAIGVPGLSPGLMMGSMAAGQAINLQYSREDEEQADRLSYGWMQKMERDPTAMKDMLRMMRRNARYRMGSETPQYLLTHPNPEARLGYIESLLETDKLQVAKKYVKADNFDFLRFKYRVLMQAMDHEKLRIFCANTLASATETEHRIMAHFGLALLAAEDRHFDQALQHLATVREQYPRKDILEIDRAMILVQSGRVEEARPILEQVVKRDGNDMYGVYQLARMELMRGNAARAEQLLQRVAVVMPEYPQLYFDLGQIESSRGREGASIFYLGKYNLYQGKIKLAKQYLGRASKDTTVPEKMRAEARGLVDKLKDLEKGI
jgi:predicted Zn-dependent protease